MKKAGRLPARTKRRLSKYLNNLIKQDHRGMKSRTGPMLSFRRFKTASITIAGIELLHSLYKGQLSLGRSHLQDKAAPAIWNAVLAA
jgi:transposase-like protein